MHSVTGDEPALMLSPLRGPAIEPVRLAGGRSLTIGRSPTNGLRLDDAGVSRRHARIDWDGGRPLVVDLESRHGVMLNGVRIAPGEPVRLRVGDRLTVNPWTFRVGGAGVAGDDSTFVTNSAEVAGSVAERVGGIAMRDLAAHRLRLLMETAEAIHGGGDEASVFDAVCRALLEGGEFQRARIVRPLEMFERVELLAERNASGAAATPVSRTLLRAAQDGGPVRLRDPAAFGAVSVACSSVVSALCVPIVVGGVPDAFAYLDSSAGSGDEGQEAVAFGVSVCRLAGLALANLRRHELELDRARTARDLEAAAVAQRRLTPPESGVVGGLAYRAWLKPGRGVGGDLFGVAGLRDGRVLVMLGDVSGKGIGAAITMAGVLSHTIAVASTTDEPAAIMAATNLFACGHTVDASFITMFLAVIDPVSGVANCCDAGHGLVLLAGADGAGTVAGVGGGMPLGIDPDASYTATSIACGEGRRLVLFSDGVVEQPGVIDAIDTEGEEQHADVEQFGLERVLSALVGSMSPDEDVRRLRESLTEFAGGSVFADDVTVLSVGLDPRSSCAADE